MTIVFLNLVKLGSNENQQLIWLGYFTPLERRLWTLLLSAIKSNNKVKKCLSDQQVDTSLADATLDILSHRS